MGERAKESKFHEKEIPNVVKMEGRNIFRTIFEISPDPVAICEFETGVYIDVNDAFEKLSQFSHSEVIGKNSQELGFWIDQSDREFYGKILLDGLLINNREICFRIKDGTIVQTIVSSRLINESGKLLLLHTIKDNSENKQLQDAKEALFKSEEMMRNSQSVAHICSYSTKLNENDIGASSWVCSPEFYRIFGIDKTYPHTINGWIGFIHPDYREKVVVYHKQVIKERAFFDHEYKIIRINDGEERWVHGTGKLEFDEKGNPVRMHGAIQDITDRKQAEDALRKSESIKNKMVSNIGDVIVIIDNDAINRYKSPNIEKWFGWKYEELLGVSTWENIHADDLKEAQNFIGNLKAEPGKSGTISVRYLCKNGDYKWIEFTGVNLLHDDDIKGILGNYKDISDRMKAELELLEAKERAEESDRLKSAFLANMSHEIRTPLNCILGFSELLSDPLIETDERDEFKRLIEFSGKNLLAIINDVMDISKIEAGQVQVYKSVFVAQQLIHDVYEEFKHLANDKGIQLSVDRNIPKSSLYLESDESKLKQVLINFVGNAIKFTEKGTIEIGFQTSENSIKFYVKDTGIGIPIKSHKHIFERFRQVEGSTTRKYGGNGLGLAISKSLVEILGGTIGMESVEGIGSTFYFHLSN